MAQFMLWLGTQERGRESTLDTQGKRVGRWAGKALKGGTFELNLERMIRV